MRFNNMARFNYLATASIGGVLVFALGLAAPRFAQSQALPDSLGGLTRQLAAYQQRGPHEKLFLHLDRPLYLSGETMWFKVYAAEGTSAQPLPLSSVAYVEVLNMARQPVLQGKVALRHATGQGSFVLPNTLPAGSYTVRAYTSWMKNFSPEAYFHTAVTVVNTSTASGAGAQDSATYDAQLFPEGGNLVRGLHGKIAVKTTNKSGKGLVASGQVVSSQGTVVATFRTTRRGMGSFSFTPTAEQEPYTAIFMLEKAPVMRRQLPAAYAKGYVLHLEDGPNNQLIISVKSTNTQPEILYLLGHSRQQTAVAQRAQLLNGQATFTVLKSQLLAGVSHFTLFNAARQPVCERLYFQAPKQQLTLDAQADKPYYTVRDKVRLSVALTDQPAATGASLSLAVYRLDSLTTDAPVAIDRYLWLAADLKGFIEDPDYYFNTNDPAVTEAADNLMLTQGWSRFRWEDVLAATPRSPEYLPEPYAPVVRAQLTQRGTARPLAGVLAYLASPSALTRLCTAQSDANGMVQFEMLDIPGAQEIVVQTDPRQDSTCRITVLDPFSTCYSETQPLAFGLTERFRHDYAKRHLQAQIQTAFTSKYRNRYAQVTADSTAFFGRPDETYLLDNYTRFKVLEEVLREYVPGVLVRIRKDGFHLLVLNKLNKSVFEDNPLVLLDGVPVFNINKIMAMNPLRIRKLDVLDRRYFQGSAIYDGIVSFSTYKGNLEEFPLDAHVLVERYEGVQLQREFYAPRYDTPQALQSRLPDLRNLLYWNPEIDLTGTTAQTLDFYTGDQAGRYLVVVQGLAANGLAGSRSFVLEVKPTL